MTKACLTFKQHYAAVAAELRDEIATCEIEPLPLPVHAHAAKSSRTPKRAPTVRRKRAHVVRLAITQPGYVSIEAMRDDVKRAADSLGTPSVPLDIDLDTSPPIPVTVPFYLRD